MNTVGILWVTVLFLKESIILMGFDHAPTQSFNRASEREFRTTWTTTAATWSNASIYGNSETP